MAQSIRISLPSAADYTRLRNLTDWGDITINQAQAALENSLFGVCLYEKDTLIAMARVVGDGVFNVYIQDVVVKPSRRRQGLGRKILNALTSHMKAHIAPDCTVGLLAAQGQDGFYEGLGFIARPHNGYGAGMSAQLKDLSL